MSDPSSYDDLLYQEERVQLLDCPALKVMESGLANRIADAVSRFGHVRWEEGLRGRKLRKAIRQDVCEAEPGMGFMVWLTLIQVVLAFIKLRRERTT